MNLFDLHADTPTAILNGLNSVVSFPEKLEKQVQTFAVFVNDTTKNPYRYYRSVIDNFKLDLEYPINDLSAPKSVLLALEGGAALEGKKENLFRLFSDGISILSLVWNGETDLAGGVNFEKGLTPFGEEIIAEMNKLGMVLDLSHLNDKSFYKAVELANLAIATHSNSRSCLEHKRNLTDHQLLQIKDKNGLVGVNFYPLFLGVEKVFESLYRHISYMLDLGLLNNISIGSDFDGAEMAFELNSTEKVLSVYEFLDKKGLDMSIIDKIFYENAFNFFKNVFDIRGQML